MKQMSVTRSKPTMNFQTTNSSQERLEYLQPHFLKEQNIMHDVNHMMGSEQKSGTIASPWKSMDNSFDFLPNRQQAIPLNGKGSRAGLGVLHEKSLFSNSLPETFSQKVSFPSRDGLFHQQTHDIQSNFHEDEPIESLEEIEARTIGNLLPDDDDLFSGIDEIECVRGTNNLNYVEDDIFDTLGGMELEIDDGIGSSKGSKHSTTVGSESYTGPNGPYSGEHPHGEHPSRTLFVRNINSSVEDDELRSLFEQYGEIRMLYTTCKHRGFVMISYYDIRSASNAMKQLQNTALRRRKLDIHYSIPKDNPSEKDINQGILAVSNLDSTVSNDDMHRIFGIYGEIKEINGVPNNHNQKVIEFYDSRAAEAALCALDGKNIAGKQLKIEPSFPLSSVHCGTRQFPSDLDQDDKRQQGSPPNFGGEYLGNTALQGKYSDSQDTISSIVGSAPNRFPSTFPHLFNTRTPSMANLDNQSGVAGIEDSLGNMNLSYQKIQTIHSHSLPERENSLAMGVFQNSHRVAPAMDTNINRHVDGMDNRNMKDGFPFDHTGASGSLRNLSCPLHGHLYSRNGLHSYHPSHQSGHMMWQNSPPFMNNIAAHSPTQLHGFPRTSSHIPNNMVSFHHHVGSAPTTNAPVWDRRHGWDSMEPSSFHPASFGSMGFSGSPILHPMDLASCNGFPFAEGNGLNAPLSASHIRIPSPQQSCHMFNSQNPKIHFNARYDVPNDRMRGRRNESTANQGENKKQYELDIERIVRGEDNRTTLMIKNIPNKYTSKMLLATIDENHRGTYDFLYLPIDFKNKCNVGYAFINLIDPKQIISFYESFNGKKWEKFNSEKVASLAYARIQGKAALVAHFQNSSLMNEDKRCRPILFHSDGPNAGDQEPFPMGSNIRPRNGRSRAHSNEDEQQGSPPNSSGGDEPSNGLNSPPSSQRLAES